MRMSKMITKFNFSLNNEFSSASALNAVLWFPNSDKAMTHCVTDSHSVLVGSCVWCVCINMTKIKHEAMKITVLMSLKRWVMQL